MEDLKVTKILNLQRFKNPDGPDRFLYTAVHFTLNGEPYFLHLDSNYTMVSTLYKGLNKGHLTLVRSCFGLALPIRFTRKPGCLKYIDREYFLQVLQDMGLLNNV